MKNSLKELTGAAIKAIRAVHSDTSGPARDNLEAIQEIAEVVAEVRECLEQDLQ